MNEITIKKIREIQQKFKTVGYSNSTKFKAYGREVLEIYPFLTVREVIGIFRNDANLILEILEKQEERVNNKVLDWSENE